MKRIVTSLMTLAAALVMSTGCGDTVLNATNTLEQAYETVRAEAQALGGAAVIVRDDEDAFVEIDDENSSLYGTKVSIPAGALPAGVRSAIFSIVPVEQPAAAAYQGSTLYSVVVDSERNTYLVVVQGIYGEEIPQLQKDLKISEPLSDDRKEAVIQALLMTQENQALCKFVDKSKEMQKTADEIVQLEKEGQLRQLEEQRRQLLEQERLRQEELKKQNEALLNKLREQRNAQQTAEQKKLIDRRLEMEERLKTEIHNAKEDARKTEETDFEMQHELKKSTAPSGAPGYTAMTAGDCTELNLEDIINEFLKTYVPRHVTSTDLMGTATHKIEVEEEESWEPTLDLAINVGVGTSCSTSTISNVAAKVLVSSADNSNVSFMLNVDESGGGVEFVVHTESLAIGEDLLLETTPSQGIEAWPSEAFCSGDSSYEMLISDGEFKLTLSEWDADGEPEEVTCSANPELDCLRATGSVLATLSMDTILETEGGGTVSVTFEDIIESFVWEEPAP